MTVFKYGFKKRTRHESPFVLEITKPTTRCDNADNQNRSDPPRSMVFVADKRTNRILKVVVS